MDPPLSPLSHQFKKETWRNTIILSFQSLGVVYGRLSTTPLYVFGAICPSDIDSDERIYELFCFVFWTLTIIPLLKYALIVMRADDDGEGGTFSLYSLLCRHAKVGLIPNDPSANEIMDYEAKKPDESKEKPRAKSAVAKHKSSHYVMLLLALYGSCIIIGDGVLTPAISVLSASTSLKRSLIMLSNVLSPVRSRHNIEKALDKFVPVPTACAILICLFTLQHYGTQRIGFIFAPIVTIWLIFITGVGLYNIFQWDHQIIYAINPKYMVRFMQNITLSSWKLLGSIVLCIAGTEAMYTDIGHFSKKSITLTFVCLVYPALVLSYAGQAAFISQHLRGPVYFYYPGDSETNYEESIHNRGFLHHIFAVLSLFSSAVGSQGTITATFTIINQCRALGCFPRVKVKHTSDKIHGRVYVPDFNWILMILSIGVTIGFHDVPRIGNATGFAIMSGMLVTTCLMSLVIALYWEKSLFVSLCFLVFFGSIETMYISSCFLNFHKGAWFLVLLLVLLMIIMLSWHYGTVKKYKHELENKVSMNWLTDLSPGLGVSRVPGIGFVYTDIVTGIPAFFSHFISVLPAFHQVLIFVSFKSLLVSHIQAHRRFLIGRVGPKEFKIYRCIVRYGYRDRVRDADDFEDHIIRSIGEFISREEHDFEDLTSPEGRMIVVGSPNEDENASSPLTPAINEPIVGTPTSLVGSIESVCCDNGGGGTPVRRKKVRFMLMPLKSPNLRVSVREELQELVDARESGTAYFLGQSHLSVRDSANFMKRFLVRSYIFLDKNCREPPVELNIPHAALLEVCMVYVI